MLDEVLLVSAIALLTVGFACSAALGRHLLQRLDEAFARLDALEQRAKASEEESQRLNSVLGEIGRKLAWHP